MSRPRRPGSGGGRGGGRATADGESGLVVARFGQQALIEAADGGRHACRLRRRHADAVCGDRVTWRRDPAGGGVVESSGRRDQLLMRQDGYGRQRLMAANIDRMVIVVAPLPPPADGQIDRYLIAAELSSIAPLLVINKCDLMAPAGELEPPDLGRYLRLGYPLYTLSSRQPESLLPLAAALNHHYAIVTGQSGVGKSSLIDSLLPDHSLEVGDLHQATGLGTHTTTTSTLYHLPGGGSLIDSPGIREFGLWPIDRQQLVNGFREIGPLTHHCRFRDCRHLDEPDCAVKRAVDEGTVDPLRYQSFRQLAATIGEEPPRQR